MTDAASFTQTWLRPIRSLYMTSTRAEIVSFRNAHKDKKVTGDDVTTEVWRALVEENVKLNVQRVAVDSTVQRVRRPRPLPPATSHPPDAVEP